MPQEVEKIFSFPEEFPTVITGLLFLDEGIIITGHSNGFIVKWKINSSKYEIIHDCGSKVETLSKSSTNKILVGCNSGLLFYFDLSKPNEKYIIQEPTYETASRVWRTVWPTDDNFFTTSTYGGLYWFSKSDSEWKNTTLVGHYHSIFGIASKNGKYLVSGDYEGKIIVRKKINGEFNIVDELRIGSSVEDIVWIKEESFATIDNRGHIIIFEFDPASKTWNQVVGADVSTSSGMCITATDDGTTIFGGSSTELIQFDIESQQIQTFQLENIRKIFSTNNKIYVLTSTGLFYFERKQIQIPLELIKYQYAKISLIGHTGVGKSTLCSSIVTGAADNIKSTLGKKIWTWTLPNINKQPEKRIIFHDHGGQETVLSTFLPFLSDSNILLVFFKQTDRSTFERAYELVKELKSVVAKKSKIYLVQTHTDEDINEVDESQIQSLVETGQIMDCFKISPKTGAGVKEFLDKLMKEIDWSNAKTMVQSQYVEALMKTITDLALKDSTVVSFNDVKQYCKTKTSLDIPTSHLNFLLTNFSSQGLIEYYPDVLKSIIFNNDQYNTLRSVVPILVQHKNGIISIKEIERKVGTSTYLQILDNVYLNYFIAIKDGNLRIFPAKLKEKGITINEPYRKFLETPLYKGEYKISLLKINISHLIRALIELKTQCIDASKIDGLFAWETNACLYYTVEEVGNSISGRYTKISYFIGGKKNEICDRLHQEFSFIVERLFGKPLTDSPDT